MFKIFASLSPPTEVFDYPRDVKNITFSRVSNSECYFFNITDDDIGEPTEHFQVMMEILSNPDVAVVDNPIANITILDDDGKQARVCC